MADATPSKTCCRCGLTKPRDEFSRNKGFKDGRNSGCKACLAQRRRERRGMTDADRAAEREALATKPTKTCGKCGETKARAEFAARKLSHDGMSPWCKACNSEYGRRHYEANAEKKNAKARDWYLANKEARNEQQRRYNRDNLERFREYNLERSLRWRRENPERWNELLTAFRQRRRARVLGSIVGPVDLEALWTGLCGICAEPIDRTLKYPDPRSQSIDHIIPLSKGGSHTQDNLQYAHLACNCRKGARVA